MTYQPPPHIGVSLSGKLTTNREVAFAVEASRLQLLDVCRAWGWAPVNVVTYSEGTFVPRAEGINLYIVDDDFNDGAAGSHNPLGGVVDVHQSESVSATTSHENNEIVGNKDLNRWFRRPDGLEEAGELCDVVQRDYYDIPVTLFGETRQVKVSNFVLPSYFQPWAPPPYDWMGVLKAPFTISEGGYAIVLRDGEIDYLATTWSSALLAEKKIAAHTARFRTSRIAAAARVAFAAKQTKEA